MSYFHYVIEYPDGTCLDLSDEGPREEEAPQFEHKLKRQGYRHVEERPLGENVLRVYEKPMPATDIVPADGEPEMARQQA